LAGAAYVGVGAFALLVQPPAQGESVVFGVVVGGAEAVMGVCVGAGVGQAAVDG